MMKVLLLCALFVFAQARVTDKSKNAVLVEAVPHEKHILLSEYDSPYQLAIDRNTNTLFFSYTANKDETFETIYLNLKDKSTGVVVGVPGGFANAVDDKRQIVYIGGREGIYKYNYDTKKVEDLQITDKNIWQMFYKDGLYFTTYPDQEVYLYRNDKVELVPQLVGKKALLVALDNKNNLFYVNDGDLFKIENGKTEPKTLGQYSANGFNTDVQGNLYFSTAEGLYRFEGEDIVKVASISNLYGFAIASDNSIVYADDKNIIELNRLIK